MSSVGEGLLVQERVPCNNCGRLDAEEIAQGVDHEYPHTSPDTFRVVRCACGLVYLNPRPVVGELDRIYPDDYYAYQIVEQRLQRPKGRPSTLRRFMEDRAIGRLRACAAGVARSEGPLRILDVGCGDGTVLNQWRAALAGQGEVSTHGVEMNEKAAEIARAQGHEITAARIEACNLPEAAFDLAYSFHVIEHVEDPASFMVALRKAIKPGGLVLMETPNVDTFDFRLLRRRHWGAYHFPRHFNLYDAKTFSALAEKAGFTVERIDYLPSAVFWVWSLHSLLFARSRRLADWLFPPVDILLRGSPWISGLMAFFTVFDIGGRWLTGRTANMRITLRPRS
jgi:2-polyprenyl-3-methyl-5-hydroxy-6-metoxy-1,4-benzoquinol methylase